MATAKGGKKGRKYGRNQAECQSYKAASTRERNKASREAYRLRHFRSAV